MKTINKLAISFVTGGNPEIEKNLIQTINNTPIQAQPYTIRHNCCDYVLNALAVISAIAGLATGIFAGIYAAGTINI